MALTLFMALQAAAATAAPPPGRLPVAAIDFDLAGYRTPGGAGCAGAAGAEVVVCGRRRSRGDYPLAHWDRIYAPRPIRAETSLGGNVTGRVHVDAVPMDRGAVSNRVLVGIRMPF